MADLPILGNLEKGLQAPPLALGGLLGSGALLGLVDLSLGIVEAVAQLPGVELIRRHGLRHQHPGTVREYLQPPLALGIPAGLAALQVEAQLGGHQAGDHRHVPGEDPDLAGMLGIDVVRLKLGVAAAAGALAALGGALFAHHNTYIEPRNFDIMLGVHSLAYALIGGLGTALGPLLGVALDIGLLESTRFFHGYRMIVFGGLVAGLLVLRPRGLLDERTLTWIRRRFS